MPHTLYSARNATQPLSDYTCCCRFSHALFVELGTILVIRPFWVESLNFFSHPSTTFRWVVLGRSCRLVNRSLEKGPDVYRTSFGTCCALLCLWGGGREHSGGLVATTLPHRRAVRRWCINSTNIICRNKFFLKWLCLAEFAGNGLTLAQTRRQCQQEFAGASCSHSTRRAHEATKTMQNSCEMKAAKIVSVCRH